MQDIADRVKHSIARVLCIDVADVQPEKRIENDLAADSLDRVEILIDLEEEFGIALTDEQAEAWTTVQSVIDSVATTCAAA